MNFQMNYCSMKCFLPFLLTLSAATITPASAHGMTPELEVVFMRALVGKCKVDQPSVAGDLEFSYKVWEKRNARFVANVDAAGEHEVTKEVSEAREAYNQSGTLTLENCQKLVADLKTSASDIHGPPAYENKRLEMTLPIAKLDRLKGKYTTKNNISYKVRRADNSLILNVDNKSFTFYPESNDTFFLKDRDVTLNFPKIEEDGRQRLVVKENGNIVDEAIRAP